MRINRQGLSEQNSSGEEIRPTIDMWSFINLKKASAQQNINYTSEEMVYKMGENTSSAIHLLEN